VTLDIEGDSLTIESGGTLSIAAGDAAVTATADEFVITNDGTIEYFDFVTGGDLGVFLARRTRPQ
jgi:hypothetical protein